MKKAHFLRGFWNLFHGYWHSEEKWKACGLLGVVISLNFAMVYLVVLINEWYKDFYDALQAYNYELFWPLLGQFTALALLHIVIAVYAIYLQQLLQIRWRTWMTKRYVSAWLNRQSYYRLQVVGSDMDNPDQRIQDDINQFVSLTLGLLVNILKQLTTLAAFAVVLWNLSGVIEVPVGSWNFQIYGYMLWFSLLYSGLGTWFAHLVGRKLIRLNYDQQRYEADFRFSMTRVRENSESIAFYRGEDAERVGFRERFGNVINNFRALMRQTKFLNFYSNFYAQLAIIAPLVLAAPRYFGGAMQLGGLMQTVSAFGRVQDALSYFVTVYDTIAQLIAVIYRLNGFTEHLDEVEALKPAVSRIDGDREELVLAEVAVALPDGRQLMTPCSLAFPRGSRLLVTGASGCGKSTLLRTLAGIWPFGKGAMYVKNDDKVLFLPQRPYLPLGTLRRALCYPMPDDGSITDDSLKDVLKRVDLAHFIDKLDTVDDWSRILSLGEQQRIAFARILITRPDWVFLDEATSALDEPREQRLYELLREELPDTGILSVGHRGTLFSQHEQELHLEEGVWSLRSIEKEPQPAV
ncbi:MAG: ABC transporter ATP-binding protein/permease [Schwartzia succinivorans]|uniref:ABC transporter ATP-binding protein/permease n=1 Tax=Schwartzia succinivorans TaxID=55507 RepID=UPI0023544546|nr:ABC transporter ATP-binding protein/permease [Schwartzia succinivorans]MBE6096743.1 ABC transporter ATP-binding protein/permease [Schwartzia succinivorans]